MGKIRNWVILALIPLSGAAQSLEGIEMCEETFRFQELRLADIVSIDDSADVLRPNQAQVMRLRDLVSGESRLEDSSTQTLLLMEGFNGPVKIWCADTLVYSGDARTNGSSGSTGVVVDLGELISSGTRKLRIAYGEECVAGIIGTALPVALLRRLKDGWLVQLQDYWPRLE